MILKAKVVLIQYPEGHSRPYSAILKDILSWFLCQKSWEVQFLSGVKKRCQNRKFSFAVTKNKKLPIFTLGIDSYEEENMDKELAHLKQHLNFRVSGCCIGIDIVCLQGLN